MVPGENPRKSKENFEMKAFNLNIEHVVAKEGRIKIERIY